MSTEATNAELNEAIMDEFGVKYSKDGRKLLKAPQNLDSTYSIKEGTKIICDMAFADCKSLRSLVVPDGVTSIGKRAFSDCTSLSSLVLPESVGNIIGNPFSGW
ncbi:leucine-rich repeat protein, partial [Prevotella copri]|nr:leucine-rich repeat protein [Segatella copri]